MVEVEIAVTKPLALTVAVKVWLAPPYVPMLEFTPAKVRAPELFMLASPETVTKVGAEPVTPTNNCPLTPTVEVPIPEAPLPNSRAFCVRVDCPVPPRVTESCPVKPGVKVCTPPTEFIVKVILASVPVAKVWEFCVCPFKELIAPEAVAQFVHAIPEAAVDEATKHKPSLPTACIPKVPAPVPVIKPPLATEEALKPRPPEVSPSGWDKVKLVMVVVASVEVAETFKVPPTVRRLEIVVEPVTAKVFELGLKVKLLDPAVLDAAVAYKIWLMERLPESLLLKVVQSAA